MPELARRAGAAIFFMTAYAVAAPVFVAVFTTRLLFGWQDGQPDDKNVSDPLD